MTSRSSRRPTPPRATSSCRTCPSRTTTRSCAHGRGYPDGLKGDEIPVSAQVVALADVYDVLTSDRCYKKAFSHETAMQMILNGECGAFNPLLLECFSAVGTTLHENLQHEPSEFDYRLESHRLSAEMLEQHSLPTDNRELQLLPLARANAVFFAEQSGGLQFVYDRWMNKVAYTNWDADEAHRQQTLYLNEGDTVNLLDREIHDALVKQVRQTSPAQPESPYPPRCTLPARISPMRSPCARSGCQATARIPTRSGSSGPKAAGIDRSRRFLRNGAQNRKEASWLTTNFSLACSPQRRR